MEEIKESCYKGTRILLGGEKRSLLTKMAYILNREYYDEISMPIIQFQDTFKGKVGVENNNLMFNFKDRGNRDICLAPEYTAVMQQLSKTTFKDKEDVRLFYIQECFRGEKPQRGRYRQFTQLGVEILNPTKDHTNTLISLAKSLVNLTAIDITIDNNVTRGLDYYKDGKGFEIRTSDLQIVGGGEYDGGIGFAIGIDRII